MTTKQVAATLGAVVLLTAVLPPLFASAINRRRVHQAVEDSSRRAELFGRVLTEADVSSGAWRCSVAREEYRPRRRIKRRGGLRAWASPLLVLGHDAPTDPWGRCYLVNVAGVAQADTAVWVLSAGTNGVIDTPFVTRVGQPLGGDDIGARVR